MKALIYLTKRSFINNIKKAVKKPTTLIALIFGVVYAIFILFSLATLVMSVRIDSVRGLMIILTAISIYLTLGNFMAYSSRKGILFRPAHAHFVFTAPIDPKLVLVNGGWMNYIMYVAIWIVIAVGGVTVFQVELWRMFFLLLAGLVLEIALEVSIMVFLYTNDHLPQKLMSGIRWFIKIFLAAFTLLIVLYFRRNGMSVESVFAFIDWKVLQIIPVIGWQISAYRLILLGPDTLNVICAALYVIFVVVAATASLRMRCGGGYYEEAAKFADDYAEIRQKKKSGDLDMNLGGKKRKFRHVKDRITGHGAKAIFYRQLLEYKKEKFFIFSKVTLIAAAIAFIFSFSMRDAATEGDMSGLFLLGIVAYMSLVMSGYIGKWETELKNPYLYLIPDTPLKKLWYATVMEHIKALADACIICIPIGIFWKVNTVYIIYCILIYTVLQADRLYTKVLAQCLVGEVFGKTGQDILRMLIQMFLLGFGAGLAVLIGIFVNVSFIYPLLLVYSIVITVGMGLLASLRFESMEQLA